MLIPREKERRLAWSLNRVSGPAVQRKRHVAPRPATAPGTGVKWDANPCTNADVGDQVQLRQPYCYYGIRYRDGTDDCKLMISSRKIKRWKTCLMFLNQNENLAYLKFIRTYVNTRANRYVKSVVYLYECPFTWGYNLELPDNDNGRRTLSPEVHYLADKRRTAT